MVDETAKMGRNKYPIPIPDPIRRLQLVLIIMHRHRYKHTLHSSEGLRPLIKFDELQKECKRFWIKDDEEIRRILRKLIADDCIRPELINALKYQLFEGQYFSITYQGVLHYLEGGYPQEHLNELEKARIFRANHYLNEQAVGLQGQMKSLGTNMNRITGAILVATIAQVLVALLNSETIARTFVVQILLPLWLY